MTCRFINPITQFGQTDYEMIVLDDAGNIIHRQPCAFAANPDEAVLQAVSDKIIAQLKTSGEAKYAAVKSATFSKTVIDQPVVGGK